MKSRVFVLASFLTAIAPSVHAADGVKLISKKSTYPIVISTPGSYRLRSNITVPDANTTAIQITANNVTLDLNGFVISGPAVCTHTPFTTCTNTGNGIGIAADSVNGTVIKDGTISGMGGDGILIRGGRIERVRVIGNGGSGIWQSGGGLGDGDLRIIDCTASLNEGAGIHLAGGIVSGSVVNFNGDVAIEVTGLGAVIVNNYLEENDRGVEIGGGGAVVTGNAAVGNYGTGFMVLGSVMNNVAKYNEGAGINSGGGSALVANAAEYNSSFGMSMGLTDGYALNVASDNNGGEPNPQTTSGLEIGSNVCGVDLTCP